MRTTFFFLLSVLSHRFPYFRVGIVMLSVFVLFQACYCVLFPLTPALIGSANRNLDLPYFLQDYFLQGYGNFEIMAFPVIAHNIFRGIRTLKRWLKGLVLKRASRRNESRLEDIVTAILDEMERWF